MLMVCGNRLIIRSACVGGRLPAWRTRLSTTPFHLKFQTSYQSTRADWEALQSEHGEVKVHRSLFSNAVLLPTYAIGVENQSGCGILVQNTSLYPDIHLLVRPKFGNHWLTVERKRQMKRTIYEGDIRWQFPPNPITESEGIYTIEDQNQIKTLVTEFLKQEDVIRPIQKALKNVWEQIVNKANTESKQETHFHVLNSCRMETVHINDIIKSLSGDNKVDKLHAHVFSYIVHLITVSSPFFSAIPGTSSYYAHTKAQVRKTNERMAVLHFLLQVKNMKEDGKNLRQSFTDFQALMKEEVIPTYYWNFERDFQPFEASPEFIQIIKNMFCSLAGITPQNEKSIQELKEKVDQFTPEEDKLDSFFQLLEHENTSMGKKTSSLLGNIARALQPTFLEMLIDRSFLNKGSHSLVQNGMTSCLKALRIQGDSKILRCLLIAMDQLPYMYCFNTEAYRRFWAEPEQAIDVYKTLDIDDKAHQLEGDISRVEYDHAIAIDGIETITVDDCISVSEGKKGEAPWIHIHIADTSSTIKPHSLIDKFAQYLVATQYFTDEYIRMLPDRIDHKLSLRTGENKVLTFSAQVHEGKIVDSKVHFSTVTKMFRLTFDQVDSILSQNQTDKISTELRTMMKIAEERKKFRKLSVEYSLTNSSGASQSLIEEFMLTAGFVAARFCAKNNIPTFYRAQNRVNEEKLLHAKKLSGVNRSTTLLEITPRAYYSLEPKEHFLGGLEMYSHVTSPLRRYADMIAHYQISSFLKGCEYPFTKEQLQHLLVHQNCRSQMLTTISRDQDVQNILYQYADHGATELQAVLTSCSVTFRGNTVLELRIPVGSDQGLKIRLRNNSWPGQYVIGDTYDVKIIVYPHLSSARAVQATSAANRAVLDSLGLSIVDL